MGKTLISAIAVIANLFLAIGKILVGLISKSAAVFADGINSGTDVVASAIGFIGVKTSEKPADKEHPYGHGKAEVISGFIITLIIFVSGIFIIYNAIMSFFNPEILKISYLVFIVMGFSALINAIMSYVKIHYGKKYDSYSLISDGIHSRIDLLVSLGIFIGLFFINYYSHVDSILALLVGLYILKESISLGKQTTDSLIGISAGEEIENEIKYLANTQKIEVTNLKTQKMGSKIFAELKIKLPSKLDVEKASYLTKKLEQELISKIGSLEYVSIQIESHDISTGYFKPELGRGFGWQRKGKFKDEIPEAEGKGPEGYCICKKCGYKIKHERGTPCSTIKCPKCKINLTRE
jgi:cation diffusion facilitator family transporter